MKLVKKYEETIDDVAFIVEKYDNGTVVRTEKTSYEYVQEPVEESDPQPTQLDRIETNQAEVLLNQAEIIVSQEYTACLLELQSL